MTTTNNAYDELFEKHTKLLAFLKQKEESEKMLENMIEKSTHEQIQSDYQSLELTQVFNAVNDAMWVIDADKVIFRANLALTTLLNIPEAEIIGRHCSEVFKLSDEILAVLEKPFQNDVLELDITDATDSYILSLTPSRTITNKMGVICQLKNITARKKAEQSLECANKRLEKLAWIDGLTTLANRRKFDEILDVEWQRLSRKQEELSLLFIDVDYFKLYNDRYGHGAGDDCLKQLGKAIHQAGLRPADLSARYGGEEFVVLLPETDSHGAQAVAGNLAEAVRELQILHEESSISEFITLSIGVATTIPNASHTITEFLKFADTLVYEAKNSGRNTQSVGKLGTPSSFVFDDTRFDKFFDTKL